MEVLLEARTLKYVFYGLLILVLLANVGALTVYLFTQAVATLTVTAIFDILFLFPVTLVFGLYVWLVGEGRKVKSEALTESLFKDIKISS